MKKGLTIFSLMAFTLLISLIFYSTQKTTTSDSRKVALAKKDQSHFIKKKALLRKKNKKRSFAIKKGSMVAKKTKKSFIIEEHPFFLWHRIKVPKGQVFSTKNARKATLAFLKQNPELLEDVPAGTNFEITHVEDLPHGTRVLLKASYNGLLYPGEKAFYFKKGRNPEELILTEIQNHTLPLKDVKICQNLSPQDAISTIKQFHQDKAFNFSQPVQKIFPAPDHQGLSGYFLMYDVKFANSKTRPYQAKIDTCQGKFLEFPHPIALN